MRRIIKILSFGLLLLSFSKVSSQEINSNIERKVYLQAILVLEQYEKYANFSNGSKYEKFLNLFASKEINIFNDVLPDNRLNEKVTVIEYVQRLIPSYCTNKSIKAELDILKIKDFKIDNSNKGSVIINVDKFISCNTKSNILYVDTFNIDFKIDFDYSNKSYLISDITAAKDYGKYLIIKANEKTLFSPKKLKNISLLLNHNEIILNEDGYYFQKRIKSGEKYTLESNDINYIGTEYISYEQIGENNNDKESKNDIVLNLRQPLFVLQFSYSILPKLSNNSPVIFKGEGFSPSFTSSSFNNYSFKVGAFINQSKKYYLKVLTGLSFGNLSYTIGVLNFQESYKTKDSVNYNYLRTNKFNGLTENHEFKFTSIPLLFEGGYNISKYNLHAGIGGELLFISNAEYTTKVDATHSGYYEDFFGITFAENGVYDFGYYPINNYSNKLDVSNQVFCLNTYFGIGRMINKRFYINLDAEYKRSLNYIFNEKKMFLSNNINEINSVSNISNKFIINSLLINLGILIKL